MRLSAETLTLLRRTVVTWVLVRLMLALLMFLMFLMGWQRKAAADPLPGAPGGMLGFFDLPLLSAAVVLAATPALVLADLRVARERALYANLGVGQGHVAAMAAATAAVLEAALRLVLR